MTRDQVNATLRYMEHVRELSYEAETKREEKRLIREYAAMYRSIKPYLEGTRPYTTEGSTQ